MLRPHAGKQFVDLAVFVNGPEAKAAGAAKGTSARPLDLDTAMRKWRAVMSTVEAQQAKRPARAKKGSPPT